MGLKLTVPIFALFFTVHLFAQGPVWDWTTNCGSSAGDKSLDVQVDSAGYVYSCGYFNGNAQFGAINFGLNWWTGRKHPFLAKQDPSGNYLWAKYGVGGADTRALGLCVDMDDNIIVTGTYWYSCSFDSNSVSGIADHIFVVKFDPAGNVLWVITGGGNGDDHGYDVVADENGDIYITGYLSTHYGPPTCTATFGSLPQFSYSDSIAFLGKISTAGQWQWVRTFYGTDVSRDNDLTLDENGNVYVCGGYYGVNRVFGSAVLSSVGGRDIFVVKYDSLGNYQWVRSVGSSYDDRANGIATGADSKLYVTGEFRGELVFGDDTLNNNGGPGGKDIFVAKLDTAGNWLWASKAGSDKGGESGRAITTTAAHNIFITGQTKGNVIFGDSTISFTTNPSDSIQIFVAAIDTAGRWRWAQECGGPNEDRGYGIDADNSCKLYYCGYFSGPTATFGPTLVTSYGTKDGFTARLNVTCFDYVSDTLSGIRDPGLSQCAPFVNNLLAPNGSTNVSTIRIVNRDCLTEASWKIYNILGVAVFESDDLNSEWNGKDQSGNSAPSGSYFYEIRGIDHSVPQSFTGQILLIR